MSLVEEEVWIDGVKAIRRRKIKATTQRNAPYLHVPMACFEALGAVKLASAGWQLAIWVIWHYVVTSGEAVSISAAFAAKAGIHSRAARRHAIASLQNTDLFEVTHDGKKAASVSVGKKMRKILGR